MRNRVLIGAVTGVAAVALVAACSSSKSSGDKGGSTGGNGGGGSKVTLKLQSLAFQKPTVAAVKKQSKAAIKGNSGWTLNLMVFLKEAAGADKINIVYYDLSGKKREQVNYSEVAVKPDQKIVQINGTAISPDLGFVKGHKYEVLATRIIGGKEKVYAKTVLTLK